MSAQVQVQGAGIGGLIQGNFGNYTVASDGTFTVDSRDLPALQAGGGMVTMAKSNNYYTTQAVATASVSAFVASTNITSGTPVAVGNQPVVPRPAQLVLTALASPGPSAGVVTIVYKANDGTVQTDAISAVTTGLTPTTNYLTKGVVHLTSITPTGIVGGTVFMTLGSTSTVSFPVAPGAVDLVVNKENVDTTDETVGTLVTGVLASITPTTVPNSTHTYSFAYTFTAPNT